jgi:hypothetical protein
MKIGNQKYDFQGIGKAEALLVFSYLATTPLAPITQGFWGKVIFWILTQLGSLAASYGLVLLNLGIENVQIIIQKGSFDGSFDEAFKAINEKGGKLTPKEKQEIDAPVMLAFDGFADFGVHGNAGEFAQRSSKDSASRK